MVTDNSHKSRSSLHLRVSSRLQVAAWVSWNGRYFPPASLQRQVISKHLVDDVISTSRRTPPLSPLVSAGHWNMHSSSSHSIFGNECTVCGKTLLCGLFFRFSDKMLLSFVGLSQRSQSWWKCSVPFPLPYCLHLKTTMRGIISRQAGVGAKRLYVRGDIRGGYGCSRRRSFHSLPARARRTASATSWHAGLRGRCTRLRRNQSGTHRPIRSSSAWPSAMARKVSVGSNVERHLDVR